MYQQYEQYNGENFENGQNNNYDYEKYVRMQYAKNSDKNILKKSGRTFAFSICAYFLLAFLMGIFIKFIVGKFPDYKVIVNNFLSLSGLTIIESILFLGLPFLISYIILKKRKITGMIPLGTTYNKKASAYIVMFMLPVVMLSTMFINYVSIIIQGISGLSFESGLENIRFTGPLEIIMAVISMALVPAIIEEFVVRGVILQPLRRYGDMFAVVVSALIFSFMHGNMVQIPYAFVGGIYFGLVAVATGSIWPTIILHFLNNLFSVIVTAVDCNVSMAAANVVAITMTLIMVIVGIVGAVLFYRMNYKIHIAKGVQTLKLSEKLSAFFLNPYMIIAFVYVLFSTMGSIS